MYMGCPRRRPPASPGAARAEPAGEMQGAAASCHATQPDRYTYIYIYINV